MLEIFLIMVISVLMVGILIGVTPYIVRRNIHFGVMLPESANELEITKRWKKQFLMWSLTMSVLGLLPMFAGLFLDLDEEGLANHVAISGTVVLAIIGIVQAVMYFHFHYQAKRLKQDRFSSEEVNRDARIMVSMDFHQQKTTVSNVWFVLVGGLIILVTAAFPFMMYDQIPDVIPVNWGFDYVSTFREKSPLVFMAVPALQLGILVIFIFTNYAFKKAKQVIRPQDAKRSMEQNIRFRQAQSMFLLVMGIFTLLITGCIQFMMAFAVEDGSWIALPSIGMVVFALFGTIYLAWKYGQGGERYKSKKSTKNINNDFQMVDDDQFWKWGMLYYNPTDPAVFVEKRFGIGMTINFARPVAWLMVLGILAFTIGTIVISLAMAN